MTDATVTASHDLHVVILAAGRGSRMKSDRPKVLHSVVGRPMLAHVLDTARALFPRRITVVVGHQAERVKAFVDRVAAEWASSDDAENERATAQPMPDIETVLQDPPRGTGHAVALALGLSSGEAAGRDADQALPQTTARVLVLYGDVPGLRPDDLGALLSSTAACAVLGAHAADPTGYGRLLLGPGDALTAIVEERDATPQQREIQWVNTGVMAADGAVLRHALADIVSRPPANASGEWYLTEVVSVLQRNGQGQAVCVRLSEGWRADGVNDQVQRSALERRLREDIVTQCQRNGLTTVAPERLVIDGRLTFGRDCEIGADVVIRGHVKLGDRVRVGQGVHLSDVEIGHDVDILPYSVLENTAVAEGASIGPFARLRPGAKIGPRARVGNFVEIKNADVHEGAKVNHLSYVGDAAVGAQANLGAGTITCNYDGRKKSRTVIGAGAFVGSNTALVAPVALGEGCTVAAGSVITEPVPDRALAIGRARQVNKPEWTAQRRERQDDLA